MTTTSTRPAPVSRGITLPAMAATPHYAGPAVHAESLVKTFKHHRAVDGIDLEVAPGEVFGVLGPNGAGKTTMLKMLATLLSIDAGHAEILGVDVRRQLHAIRQLVGVTGQYASVDENLTATESLVPFGRLQGLGRPESRRTAASLLEQFGLQDAATRTIKEISGGMRRRLDLAASLIMSPPVIFLDEPTTGLDPRTRGQMWDTIRALVAGGSTILLTTQYLDEADVLADRIAVIDHGRKVAEGTPDELKAAVGNSTLQLGLTDPSQLAAALALVARRIRATPVASPERAQLHVPLEHADDAAALLIALRDAGISVSAVSVQQPSLDEVFLALTGHDTGAANTNISTTDDTTDDPTDDPSTDQTTRTIDTSEVTS